MISVIVPCFNEEENVSLIHAALSEALHTLEYELIFVDDGSRDATMPGLRMVYESDREHVKVVGFSRNFGKEAGIYAGLMHVAEESEYVSIIDADLQQRPEYIVQMVDFLEKNADYDAVAMYQAERKESALLSAAKNGFYTLMKKVTGLDMQNGASDFRVFRKGVADALCSMPEYHRFSKGLFSWIGFRTFYMEYVAEERRNGTTKWSGKALIHYAIDGIVSFSTLPLKLGIYLGILVALGSLIYMVYVSVQTLVFGNAVPGYPTIIGLILLLGGVQLIILGIIGEYLSKMYIQGKNRPIYIEKTYLGKQETTSQKN